MCVRTVVFGSYSDAAGDCSCTLSRDVVLFVFFFNDTSTTELYTLSLRDALPIFGGVLVQGVHAAAVEAEPFAGQERLHALVPATDPVVETLDDGPSPAMRFERFQQLGHLEVGARCFREECRGVHSVLGSDADQSLRISRPGGRNPWCAERHRLEQRQTDRDTGAAEERPAVEFQGTK